MHLFWLLAGPVILMAACTEKEAQLEEEHTPEVCYFHLMACYDEVELAFSTPLVLCAGVLGIPNPA